MISGLDFSRPDKLVLSKDDILRIIPISPVVLSSWIKEGIFPKGKSIGKITLWHRNDVLKWIDRIQSEDSLKNGEGFETSP